jgi:hypothetical protein
MTRIRLTWRTYGILSLSLMGSLLLGSCGSGPVPRWDEPIWAGDSKRGGITRAQANQHISCSDPAFDDYVAVRYDGLRELFAIMLSCEKWPKGMKMMSAKEALARMKILMKDLEREAIEEELRK